MPRSPLTVLVLAAAALPGCAVEQAEGQDPTPSAPAAVRADTLAGVARRIYHQQADGTVGHTAAVSDNRRRSAIRSVLALDVGGTSVKSAIVGPSGGLAGPPG